MGPIAHADGHNGPGLSLELVPCIATVINESMDVVEHAVGEPVVADELPDILLRVQFGAFRWQRDDGDVVWNDEMVREVPSGLIGQQQCMTARRHIGRDRCEMQVHHRGVAPGQDQTDGLALLGTDGTEDVGRRGALVGWRGRTAAAPGPAACDLVLLANSGLVGEPDLNGGGIEAPPMRDCRHCRRPVFMGKPSPPPQQRKLSGQSEAKEF